MPSPLGISLAVIYLILVAVDCSQSKHDNANSRRESFRDKVHDSYRSALKLAITIPAHCPKRIDPNERIGRTKVTLYSPSNQEDIDIELDPNNLDRCAWDLVYRGGFNLWAPSVLYSPGWREEGDILWLRQIRHRYSALLGADSRRNGYNLIFFDFYEDSHLSYGKAARKVPKLGRLLADFLLALRRRFNYSMSQIHLIGFSLSAHIVGVAGRHLRRVGNPIRQISVLDPAGPCFFGDSEFSYESTVGLDSAELVVARHYGFGVFGAKRKLGGIDIFINGGFKQPAELQKAESHRLVRKLNGSHRASALHEALSGADKMCHSVAYKCDSYRSFLDGACANCDHDNTGCFLIDTLASGSTLNSLPHYPLNETMYIDAGGRTFCLFHYQLVVLLSPTVSLETIDAFRDGQVTIDLGWGLGRVAPRRQTRCAGYRAYTILVTSENSLNLEGTIMLNEKSRVNVSPSEVLLVRLNFMSHPSREERMARSITLCPNGSHLLHASACRAEQINLVCY